MAKNENQMNSSVRDIYSRIRDRGQPIYERVTIYIAVLALLCGSNLFNKKTMLLSMAAFVPFVIARRNDVIRAGLRLKWLAVLVAFYAASYFWSLMPQISFPFIWTQVVFVVFAFVVAASGSWAALSRAMYLAALTHVVLVSLYCFVNPAGSWTGSGLRAFYLQKNMLGAIVSLDALILLTCGPRGGVKTVALVWAVVLTVLSFSKTSMIFLFLASFAWLFVKYGVIDSLRPNSKPSLDGPYLARSLAWLVIFVGICVIPLYSSSIASYIAGNVSKEFLTGRGTLWSIVFRTLGDRALLGLGPGIFWQADANSEITQTSAYYTDSQWLGGMISADGSYVDLVASIGFAGLALFLLFVQQFVSRLLCVRDRSVVQFALPIAVFFLGHSISESTILYSTNAGWFMFLLAAQRVDIEYYASDNSGLWARIWRV